MTPPSTGAARRVIFQHADPNDIMPTPRKLKKLGRNNALSAISRPIASEQIEIYNDASARIPRRDESEDNPFIGQRIKHNRSELRSSPALAEPMGANMDDEEMQKRADSGEGLIFTFRGKKVFRPYDDSIDADVAKNLGYRPIRRSRTRPIRLTFGTDAVEEDHVDEEALTEIEDEGEGLPGMTSSQNSAGAASPKRTVRSLESSMFSSWRRVREDTSSMSRKRDAVGQGSDSNSKRTKNSP
ncbi:hypothetical protein MRB53_040080 [Persea americana]|nr:hypothetical protein MRB53_040080 [Persea americana]